MARYGTLFGSGPDTWAAINQEHIKKKKAATAVLFFIALTLYSVSRFKILVSAPPHYKNKSKILLSSSPLIETLIFLIAAIDSSNSTIDALTTSSEISSPKTRVI